MNKIFFLYFLKNLFTNLKIKINGTQINANQLANIAKNETQT